MLVQYDLYFGTYEKAMRHAKPIIDGKMSCNMIPLRTHGCLVNPVYRMGNYELAEKIYTKGIKLIGNKAGFLELVGFYLVYLSNVNTKKAVNLFP